MAELDFLPYSTALQKRLRDILQVSRAPSFIDVHTPPIPVFVIADPNSSLFQSPTIAQSDVATAAGWVLLETVPTGKIRKYSSIRTLAPAGGTTTSLAISDGTNYAVITDQAAATTCLFVQKDIVVKAGQRVYCFMSAAGVGNITYTRMYAEEDAL